MDTAGDLKPLIAAAASGRPSAEGQQGEGGGFGEGGILDVLEVAACGDDR